VLDTKLNIEREREREREKEAVLGKRGKRRGATFHLSLIIDSTWVGFNPNFLDHGFALKVFHS
jgi:hypothetical protein